MAEDAEVKKQLEELVALNKQLLAQNEEVKKSNTDLVKANEKLQSDVDELLKMEDGGACDMEDGSKGTLKFGKCVAKVDKALIPESVQKAMDAQTVEIKKQADVIAKMQEEKAEKEWVGKAAAYTNLPIKAEELGPILKSASKSMNEAQLKELDRVLKAGDEAIATVMKINGSNAGGGNTTAYDSLMAKAKDIQKSDKVSIEKAFTVACDQNPELFKQHRAEQRGH